MATILSCKAGSKYARNQDALVTSQAAAACEEAANNIMARIAFPGGGSSPESPGDDGGTAS